MAQFYPLLFRPVFKKAVWGGRQLSRFFPALPQGPIGEAWVLSGHPKGPTPVVNGPLAGQTLAELMTAYGTDLVGTRGRSDKTGAFPLLFKLLDAQDKLSVQVHPTDEYKGLPAKELGKTEMWVVLHAEPGAKVVYGLKSGTTPAAFAAAVAAGKTMDVMRELPVQTGDVLYVPAGTVHALCRGLLVAEIQQSSDTTYRIYDYNRPGLDGKPRDLHVNHALRVAQYGEPPEVVRAEVRVLNDWDEICRSPYFVVEHGQCNGIWSQRTTRASFQAIMVLEGQGTVTWLGGQETLRAGTTMLVPARLGPYELQGRFKALRVAMP